MREPVESDRRRPRTRLRMDIVRVRADFGDLGVDEEGRSEQLKVGEVGDTRESMDG